MADIVMKLKAAACPPNTGCMSMTVCVCDAMEDAADEIERLRKTVMDLCIRNDKLGDILTEAVMDHSSARHMQFDWIDAAREAIGRKPA